MVGDPRVLTPLFEFRDSRQSTVANTVLQILAATVNRVTFAVNPQGGADLFISPNRTMTAASPRGFQFPVAVAVPFIFTTRDFGSLIQREWFALSTFGPTTLYVMEVWYFPERGIPGDWQTAADRLQENFPRVG